MTAIRSLPHPQLAMPAAPGFPAEIGLRFLLRSILVPLCLVFCAVLVGIDAICKVLATPWRGPRI